MAANNNYLKITTPIRKIKSEIGQVVISLFNDQISLGFQPASGKTEYGTIKYNGSTQFSANVRFSVGVAAAIAELIRKQIVPVADNVNNIGHWEVFACKRKTYEAYVLFDVNGGIITMTGIEVTNGIKKQAAYTFPVTIITEGQNKSVNIQGEALALADLFSEIGAGNEMPIHMRQYNQAVKDNIPAGGYQTQSQSNQGSFQSQAQPMNTWRPQ